MDTAPYHRKRMSRCEANSAVRGKLVATRDSGVGGRL